MEFGKVLTPEEAEAMGIPRSVLVISPAYGSRSRASTSNKSQPSSGGSETLESSLQSAESDSAQPKSDTDHV
jgi:hypothetical protein